MDTNSGQASVSGATQSVEYAGFWVRFAAYFLDSAIIMILFLVIGIGASFAGEAAAAIGIIALVLINLLYFPVMESSARQATFGKSLVGIKVTDLDGRRLSFMQALLRTIAKILSAIPFSIGFLLAAFTKRKQALHDMLAKCLVVRTGPSHLLKMIATAVGGLVVVIGSGGAYFYYVYMPQITGAMQEAAKSTATAPLPPVAKAPAKPTTVDTKPTVLASPAAASSPAIPATQGARLMTPEELKKFKAEFENADKAGLVTHFETASKTGKTTSPSLGKPGTVLPAINTKNESEAKQQQPAKESAAQVSATTGGEKNIKAKPKRVMRAKIDTPPAPQIVAVEVAVPEPQKNIITTKFNDVFTAVMYQDMAAVKELLDLGWWVDKPESGGSTPLMAAVKIDDTAMAEMLLKHGANPNIFAHGDSTLRLARRNHNAAMVALLQHYGATAE